MVIFTKVNGWTIRPLEKEFTDTTMELSMKESGLMIINTGRA